MKEDKDKLINRLIEEGLVNNGFNPLYKTLKEINPNSQILTETYKIVSDYKLTSDWLPDEIFTKIFTCTSHAVSTAIEGMEDDGKDGDKILVVCIETGEIYWDSSKRNFNSYDNDDLLAPFQP